LKADETKQALQQRQVHGLDSSFQVNDDFELFSLWMPIHVYGRSASPYTIAISLIYSGNIYPLRIPLFLNNTNSQLAQLTPALRQQMPKEIHENQQQKSMNCRLSSGSPGEIQISVWNIGFKTQLSPIYGRKSRNKLRIGFKSHF
jgi:hypothetical protein